MSIIARLQRAMTRFTDADRVVADVEVAEDESELENLRRQKEELFDLVVRIEKQRDDWKTRFFEQAHQHQNAQAMLEDHVRVVGTTLVRTVEILNELRVKNGLEPMTSIMLRDAAMKGEAMLRTSTEYGEAMRKLAGSAFKRDRFGTIVGPSDNPAEPDVDGKHERDVIVGC